MPPITQGVRFTICIEEAPISNIGPIPTTMSEDLLLFYFFKVLYKDDVNFWDCIVLEIGEWVKMEKGWNDTYREKQVYWE